LDNRRTSVNRHRAFTRSFSKVPCSQNHGTNTGQKITGVRIMDGQYAVCRSSPCIDPETRHPLISNLRALKLLNTKSSVDLNFLVCFFFWSLGGTKSGAMNNLLGCSRACFSQQARPRFSQASDSRNRAHRQSRGQTVTIGLRSSASVPCGRRGGFFF